MNGDVLRESDPYFPFELALQRWQESFRRIGIAFRGASLNLDLLEREGKYQNGFCHAPLPAYFDEGTWFRPRQLQFEGSPRQVGSGQSAIHTLSTKAATPPLRERAAELSLLLAGVPADVDGLRGDAVHVLRQHPWGRRLADALCEKDRRRAHAERAH